MRCSVVCSCLEAADTLMQCGCQMNLTSTPAYSFILYYPQPCNFPACSSSSSVPFRISAFIKSESGEKNNICLSQLWMEKLSFKAFISLNERKCIDYISQTWWRLHPRRQELSTSDSLEPISQPWTRHKFPRWRQMLQPSVTSSDPRSLSPIQIFAEVAKIP